MTDKFDIKDYFNYSISGILWLVIIIKFLLEISILKTDDVFRFSQINNADIYIVLIALFGSYILGNLLRFTEGLLLFIVKIFYGDLYETALKSDRDKYKTIKEKNKAFGLSFALFKKEPLCIGGRSSIIIEGNLKVLKIFNGSKKNQHIMCESFLDMKFSKLNFQRLKNLKNFYESMSFPLFVITIWISYSLLCNNSVDCLMKIIVITILLYIACRFVDRYRFLKSNYIKNVYRYFVFLEKMMITE